MWQDGFHSRKNELRRFSEREREIGYILYKRQQWQLFELEVTIKSVSDVELFLAYTTLFLSALTLTTSSLFLCNKKSLSLQYIF